MFTDIERYINFLEKNKLTQAQFMMCYLVYRKRYDLAKQFCSIYPTDDGTFIGQSAKEDLIRRNFIIKVDENGGEYLSNYEVSTAFKKAICDKYEVGNQFWDLYPSIITIKGVNYPLTLMDKFDFRNIYLERIGYDLAEHQEVMKDIQYGKDHGLIKCGIEKFLRSENWNSIRKIRKGIESPIIDDNTQIVEI